MGAVPWQVLIALVDTGVGLFRADERVFEVMLEGWMGPVFPTTWLTPASSTSVPTGYVSVEVPIGVVGVVEPTLTCRGRPSMIDLKALCRFRSGFLELCPGRLVLFGYAVG